MTNTDRQWSRLARNAAEAHTLWYDTRISRRYAKRSARRAARRFATADLRDRTFDAGRASP
jgi:hypothetical protein